MLRPHFLLTVVVAFGIAVSAYGQSSQPFYRWSHAAIGGGGYVAGVVVHPQEPDVVYMRTDIGGAYRYDSQQQRWIQLLDWVPYDRFGLFKTDGMALDPNDPDVLYLCLGDRYDPSGSDVLKSNDRGANWQFTNLNGGIQGQFMGNFGEAKRMGERIAVDPNNGQVVLVGTRNQGLFYSEDGADTWSEAVATVPSGEANDGVRCVVFDPTSSDQGRSQIIYVGVSDEGVHQSTDGGKTFRALAGGPASPVRMAVSAQGALVVVHDAGVSRYLDGDWADVTPAGYQGFEFSGLSVDPSNPDYLVSAVLNEVVTPQGDWNHQPVFWSKDNGDSWTEAELAPDYSSSPGWFPDQYFAAHTAQVAIDPHYPGRVYLVDWYATWRTDNLERKPSRWEALMPGHEETVPLALASPPSGPVVLYNAQADNLGMRHTDVDEYPEGKIIPDQFYANNSTSIVFHEADPRYVAMEGHFSHTGGEEAIYFSDDYGETFERKNTPQGAQTRFGKLAYSATDPDNLVYVPLNSPPYYTTNRGDTWQPVAGVDGLPITRESDDQWSFDSPLAADRVNGTTFYLYEGGTFYRSEDGGATFTETTGSAQLPSKNGLYVKVKAAPGEEGSVLVSVDYSGAWISDDGGDTFREVGDFDRALFGAWGAAAPESSTPTAYVYGQRGSEWGVYRSTDLGADWVRVNDDAHLLGNQVTGMEGDSRVYGRVFVNSIGSGIYRGEIDEDPDPPLVPSELQAEQTLVNRVTLRWKDNAFNELAYVVERRSGDAAFVALDTLPANTTIYQDSSLAADSAYTYRVYAYHSLERSASSEEAAIRYTATTERLQLTSLCSNDPDYELRWRIRNTNDFSVEATWQLYGHREGTWLVPPGEHAYFTRRVAGANTLVVRWKDRGESLNTTKAASLAQCDLPVPAPPQALTARAYTDTQINLAWDDEADNEAGFRVERRGTEGPFQEIGRTNTNVTTYQDTTVQGGVTYTYRVRAYNESGSSYDTEEVEVTSLPTGELIINPYFAFGLEAWETREATVTMENENGEEPVVRAQDRTYPWAGVAQFITERLAASGPGTYQLSARVRLAPGEASSGEQPVQIIVESKGKVADPQYPGVAGVISDSTWTEISGTITIDWAEELQYSLVYVFTDESMDAYDLSEISLVKLTGQDTRPEAPTALRGGGYSPSQINLAWKDNASGENGFVVQRRLEGESVFIDLDTVGIDVVQYEDTVLTAGTEYTYRVAAYSAGGNSEATDELTVSTLAEDELLRNPTFETGVPPWLARESTLSLETDTVEANQRAIQVTDRLYEWAGATQMLTDQLTRVGPGTFRLQGDVRLAEATPAFFLLEYQDATGTYFPSVEVAATDDWTTVTGALTLAWEGSLTYAQLYLFTDSSTVSYALDNMSLVKVDSDVVLRAGNEPGSVAPESKVAPRIFPNPARDQLFVDIEKGGSPVLLRIVDATGRVVLEKKRVKRQPLVLPPLPDGVYTVILQNRYGSSTHRLVKRND